ncbi:TorD/DmsD family molecular chaperone [Salisediminibacterium beveridgei]|uniref:Cytoplasmic Chaperone TorD Family Protein n=1 Tax=Salisediminibacterium beveridgei TaxID=632773 RepID=A0A1D7QRV0_9BACI|nr:molecular chaperone TorD family protein [Salisediminibacterium beveridgei]AOM81730.1 Cytoplasmic Chaperone TorD Family Protein [Salisediminibacterium beveridgei]
MTQATDTDVKPLMEVRMNYYDILRRLFRQEPDQQLLNDLAELLLNELPFEEEDPKLEEGRLLMQEALSVEGIFDRLHWDYTRMFIGPYRLPAPIWESAYTNKDGLLFQNETREVRLHYLKYSFLPEQYQKEADDHLGLELDFMYRLSCMTRDACEKEDLLQLMELLTDQQSFLSSHLRNWLPAFIQNVSASADTTFYRGAVKILDAVTSLDQAALEELKNYVWNDE